MPHISSHRKVKRATVLIKRTQCLRNYVKNRSYKPLYEKLKNNNNSLARALSKEKQECQLLFSQNVALIAEVHDLGLACNKRDTVISDVLKNAKEMLKMLVTITGFVTNTISSCQEFVTSTNNNVQSLHNTVGRKDSYRRLSTKSPARGVVKPMVSGHTITKPTINLSRVNMQHVNNPPSLSTIQEAPVTPDRNQDDIISPVAVPISRQVRYQSRRACRKPERLTVASPRITDEDERRLSRRSRHSGRLSGRYSKSKSGRFSGNHVTRHSAEYVEYVRSPRVKLNDVSKLLQNSHSVNIRMLDQDESDFLSESPNASNTTLHINSSTNVIIPATQVSDDSSEEENRNSMKSRTEEFDKNSNTNHESQKTSKQKHNTSSDMEDPLEGPSWLFNDTQTSSCPKGRDTKTDYKSVLNNSTCSASSKTPESNNLSNNMQNAQKVSILPNSINYISESQDSSMEESLTNNKTTNNTTSEVQADDNSFCSMLNFTAVNSEQNEYKMAEDVTSNFARFITQRRGHPQAVDIDNDMDDFTLMYMHQPNQNTQFDINDLRLPILEGSVITPPVVNEPEPEITTNVQRISQNCSIPMISNNSINESVFHQSTIKLPLLLNNGPLDEDSILIRDKQSNMLTQKKKTKKNISGQKSILQCTDTVNKKETKQKMKIKDAKDPSTAKVVLEKLTDSHVKRSTPSPEEMHARESINPSRRTPVSFQIDNSSDSESSNASTYSKLPVHRPRRRKAPVNLQEPNMKKKLRRNE